VALGEIVRAAEEGIGKCTGCSVCGRRLGYTIRNTISMHMPCLPPSCPHPLVTARKIQTGNHFQGEVEVYPFIQYTTNKLLNMKWQEVTSAVS
jgi:hypothetical protein